MTIQQRDKILAQENIGFKFAAGVLLYNKKISFSEIQALPTVENNNDVERIIDLLSTYFEIEKVSKKISSYPALQWDTEITLK